MSIIEFFVNLHDLCKEYYNENCVLFMEVGDFYEYYQIQDLAEKNVGIDIKYISKQLNLILTKKNKQIKEVSISNPLMIGFKSSFVDKYVELLVNLDITVILVDQIEEIEEEFAKKNVEQKKTRKISKVFSPSTYMNTENIDINFFTVIYKEDIPDKNSDIVLTAYGISEIDITTGQVLLHEFVPSKYNIANPKTYNVQDKINHIIKQSKEHVIIDEKNIQHYKEEYNEYILNVDHEESILDETYVILNSIVELNLEYSELSRNALVLSIYHIERYNKKLLKNLQKPEILIDDDDTYLCNNAIYELDILPNDNNGKKSLFDIVNNTCTTFGQRYLKEQIANPKHNIEYLNYNYEQINYYYENQEKLETLRSQLNQLSDLERLVRKLSLCQVNTEDLYSIISDLKITKEIIEQNDFLPIFQKYFIVDNLEMTINCDDTNYDENGILVQIMNFSYDETQTLEKLYNNVGNKKQSQQELQNEIQELIGKKETIKLEQNKDQKKYIQITLKNYSEFNKEILDIINKYNYEVEIKEMKNGVKLFLDDNTTMIINEDEIKYKKHIKKMYKKALTEIYNEYKNELHDIINKIKHIDFIENGAYNAIKNKYTRPIIKHQEKSFISAKEIRHPIVEKINKYEYEPFDVDIGEMILYGLNSSGKSTLEKSIAVNLLMAEIGYFVAAEEFVFQPYKKIITRITGNDDIYRGLSSFMIELEELNNIIKLSDENTLVVADEISRGTEYESSIVIVKSIIKILIENNASFITATHILELEFDDEEIDKKNLQIKSIHIDIDKNNKEIIYNRELVDGNKTIKMYGLEIALIIFDDKKFADFCQKQLGDQEVKKSKYNSLLEIKKCQICESNEQLNTHHIKFEKEADENGYIGNVHKNNLENLCVLCEECHKKLHEGKIEIDGNIITNNQIILKFKEMEK